MKNALIFWLQNYAAIPAFGLVVLGIGLIKFPEDQQAIAFWAILIGILTLITIIYCLLKKRDPNGNED